MHLSQIHINLICILCSKFNNRIKMSSKKLIKKEECITSEGFFLPRKGEKKHITIAHCMYEVLKESGNLNKWSANEGFVKDFNKMVELAVKINWNGGITEAGKYTIESMRNLDIFYYDVGDKRECARMIKTLTVNIYDDIREYCEAKIMEKYLLQQIRRIDKERQHYSNRLTDIRVQIPELHWANT